MEERERRNGRVKSEVGGGRGRNREHDGRK